MLHEPTVPKRILRSAIDIIDRDDEIAQIITACDLQ